ncbi:calcium homeostasis endoplasmic reticulum protein isoform X2 [Tribolium castaneum]|uniref:calcium homeostasis endoplasmic reticulum protein isoform X2 n=1 Tax=Tribolium castaneum TaxID=7070 RepID=UPI0030FF2247
MTRQSFAKTRKNLIIFTQNLLISVLLTERIKFGAVLIGKVLVLRSFAQQVDCNGFAAAAPRNGPEFEQMTKNKQKGNPKFQFLYGGEYYNYYQYKVTTEQAVLKQQGILENSPNNWNSPSTMHNSEIEQISMQQDSLREQIKQSEQNLSAQHTVLLQQQQAQAEAVVAKCEAAALQKEAEACDIILEDIYNILQPIIESCTKDSISNGKSWFLQHANSKEQAYCIVHCLLTKVIEASVFSQKLHVIYLVNDLLHHCARKNANELKEALESVVVPMFCNAHISATEDQRAKLEKLLKLWESKANYLDPNTVEKMRQPTQSYQQYQSQLMMKYASEIGSLAQQTKQTYDNYQAQHQAFVCHAMQQIADLQQQKQNIEQQPPPPPQQQPPPMQNTNIIPLDPIQASLQQTIQNLSQQNSSQNQATNPSFHQPPPNQPTNDFLPINPSIPPPNITTHPPPPLGQSPNLPTNGMDNPFSQPPPGYFPPPGVFPDFSKPPPGFAPNPEPPVVEELVPTAPYYDLPAGLMVPLIKLEDTSYKPLDPKDIRLPPPAPPSDRLLAAVEAFYSLPSHERPRDSEGWEKLGLYEYYKAKNNAKRQKEEQIAAGLREKSRSPSPIVLPMEKEPSPPKRRYTSKSPSPQRRRSKSRSKSRSRSRSPRTPRRRHSRSGGRRRRSVSRSPSRSPVRRSPSPPPTLSFSAPPSFVRNEKQEIDSTNKGHQMLRKMGWGGSGLGANEQGIDAPISGGDVRDRQDQFKGVGCNLNDPYENFRKNKGAAFITRMKARAEERANESKLLDY